MTSLFGVSPVHMVMFKAAWLINICMPLCQRNPRLSASRRKGVNAGLGMTSWTYMFLPIVS